MLTDKATTVANSLCLYITLNQAQGRNIIWPGLMLINDTYKLGMVFRKNDGVVEFPNGSKILIRGASTRKDIEALRGMKYPIVVIDEAQAFGADLKYLVNDVLLPATLDYGLRAPIVLTGTPNAAMAGVFYEAVTGRDAHWEVFQWTLMDNPHIPDKEEAIAQILSVNNWTESHPTFIREYLGKWIRDIEGLVFRFEKTKHRMATVWSPRLADDIKYVIGVDLGFNDPCAFVVMAYSREQGMSWVIEASQESGMEPTAAGIRVKSLLLKYPKATVVADSGGIGKGYIKEWENRMSLAVIPAEKKDKLAYVSLLNSDLDRRTLAFDPIKTTELMANLELLQWDQDRLSRGAWEYDRRYEDHLPDAMLYAWRHCQHFLLKTQYDVEQVQYESKEWFETERRKMREQAMKQHKAQAREKNKPWWMKARR